MASNSEIVDAINSIIRKVNELDNRTIKLDSRITKLEQTPTPVIRDFVITEEPAKTAKKEEYPERYFTSDYIF